MFVCNGLIKDFRKRHNTIKSSTFGSELVALRIYRNMIVELRIKLKSIRVPLKGLTDFYYDNQGVVKNTSVIKPMLNKKHNSINYQVVCELAVSYFTTRKNMDTANSHTTW